MFIDRIVLEYNIHTGDIINIIEKKFIIKFYKTKKSSTCAGFFNQLLKLFMLFGLQLI